MGELLRRFYDIWRASILEGVRPVYFRGGEPIAQAMQALGMELEQPKGETRIEFLSPNRGAFSGAWIEKLPESGEAIQRVFAALFQGRTRVTFCGAAQGVRFEGAFGLAQTSGI